MCWHWHWHSFHQRHTYCDQLFPIVTNIVWCNTTIQQSVAYRGLHVSTVLYVCLLEKIRYIHTKDRHFLGTVLCDSVCSQSDGHLTGIVHRHVLFQFSPVSTLTRLQAGQSGVRILVGGRDFFILNNAQTGSRLTYTRIEE